MSESRIWTDASGRALEAVATGADETSVRLRVPATQQVYTVPLERLSTADQEFVAGWRRRYPGIVRLEPAPPDRWPSDYGRGPEVLLSLAPKEAGKGRVWRTACYEIRDFGGLDADTIKALAGICEAIDGACRSVPLPLLWGSSTEKRRIISIHPSESSYRAAGGLPGSSGCFLFSTGEVLICAPYLLERDFFGMARGFTLAKRNRYGLLVHELVHQASMGVTLGDFPAWVPEGLAEYFSAVQRSPGNFRFRDSHVAVRAHAIGSLPFDGLVELESYRLWTLDRFLDRRFREWNRINAAEDGRGMIQYFQAVVMMEYFCRGDSPEGQRFRSYLEAVLTGADRHEAADRHLLAGRSHGELETAITAYWSRRGLNLQFVPSPSFQRGEARLGIGVERMNR